MATPYPGMDPEYLKQLIASFAPSDADKNTAKFQGLLAMGLGMMGAKKGGEFAQFGNAGLLGMDTRQKYLAQATAEKGAGLNQAINAMQLQGAMQSQADDAQYRQAMQNRYTQPAAIAADNSGAPPPPPGAVAPASGARLSTSKMSDYEAAIQQAQYLESKGIAPKYVEAAYAQAEKLRPKVKEQSVGQDAQGNRVKYVLFEDGTTSILPIGPDKEKAHFGSTGGTVDIPMDPFTGKPIGAGLPSTMSAGETANNKVALARLELERAAAARAAANENKPQIITGANGDVYAVNPRTATGTEVTGSDGKPLNKGQKLTEQQANATAFGTRMAASHAIINKLEDSGYNTGSPKNLLAANSVTNYAASPEAQSLYQAKLNFMTASLRKESGAAISSSEFASEDKKYFAQPGDSAKVIQQKRDARNLALKAMAEQAGPGGAQFTAPAQKKTVKWSDLP